MRKDFKKNLCLFVDKKATKIKSGNGTTKIQTDKDFITIRVLKLNSFNCTHWFLLNMFFFVISVFGIFNRNIDKKFWVLDCEYKIELKDDITDFELMYEFQKNGGRSVMAKTKAEFQTIKHICYVDELAKQRHKKMRWAKIGVVAVFAVAVALLIVLLNIKNV